MFTKSVWTHSVVISFFVKVLDAWYAVGMKLKDARQIHMIGIGGIGMSALARMFVDHGLRVTGSDTHASVVSEKLLNIGISISYEQSENSLPDGVDAVVRTIAVSETNPEYKKALSRGVPTFTYPEALAQMTEGRTVIAVSGTHGKTTTTAMIAHVMKEVGLDPTVIVGSFLSETGTNYVSGKGNYVVIEACEYRRSFLQFNPTYVVITNIESDHLDYYTDLSDIEKAFHEFALKVPPQGRVIADTTQPTVVRALSGIDAPVVKYESQDVVLRVPGIHNRKNAGAVVALMETLGVPREVSLAALTTFNGTWRRFEYKGRVSGGAVLYDDYAHHPTEISATLQGARELSPDKNIVAVFEPHLFSRTKQLFQGFVESLSSADRVVLLPIYASREKDDGSINSMMLGDAIKEKGINTSVYASFNEAQSLISTFDDTHVVVMLGAGDIYMLTQSVINLE